MNNRLPNVVLLIGTEFYYFRMPGGTHSHAGRFGGFCSIHRRLFDFTIFVKLNEADFVRCSDCAPALGMQGVPGKSLAKKKLLI